MHNNFFESLDWLPTVRLRALDARPSRRFQLPRAGPRSTERARRPNARVRTHWQEGPAMAGALLGRVAAFPAQCAQYTELLRLGASLAARLRPPHARAATRGLALGAHADVRAWPE